MAHTTDILIIGAGAAGLMAALTAGYRGRRVIVLDHAGKPGKKILMSGGGRCNFTNLNSTPANFLSANPSFCISALKRYTPWDFLELVERHGVAHVEKAPGQLFCQGSSKDILGLLLTECEWAGVEIRLNVSVDRVERQGGGYQIRTSESLYQCDSLIVACGGLSIPTMGASGFGYNLAREFGLQVMPTRAGLVPFTVHPEQKTRFGPLAGISCDVAVHAENEPRVSFAEPMLFTHRGLSGPAMLQISSFWEPGADLVIDLLPGLSLTEELPQVRNSTPQKTLAQYCGERLPKRLAQMLAEQHDWQRPLQTFSNAEIDRATAVLKSWKVKPAGTEGYRTAEVTLGGVDTRQLSSRTMGVNGIPGLFFIGEVVDITGHLGGHNFQWAWASGVAAGSVA